jgi:signal transduction histidine kinase/ligand-binding sensor domain-containing protein
MVLLRGAFSQPASLESRFQISHFTTESGLPQNTVDALLQTSDGYIWIGTHAGLARYDGRHLRVFANELQFPESNGAWVRHLLEDSSGRLWIRVNEDGLIRWSPASPQYFSMKKLLPPGDVLYSVIARRKGGLWIGSRTGLRLFEDGKITRSWLRAGELGLASVGDAWEDSEGRLWLMEPAPQNKKNFVRFDPDTGSSRDIDQLAPFLNREEPASLSCGDDGSVWFLLPDELVIWKGDKVQRFPGPRPKGANDFQGVEFLGHAEIWLRARKGTAAVRFRNGAWFEFDRQNGLAFPDVRNCLVDREGGVWIGTGRRGVQLLQPNRVEMPLSSETMSSDEAFTVTATRDGRIVVGENSGIQILEAGRWTTIMNTETNALSPRRTGIKTALFRRNGTLVAGVHDTGLQQLRDGRLVRITAADAVGSAVWHPHSLFEDSRSRLWVGSIHGLLVENGNGFDRFTRKHGLFSDAAGAMVEAPDGSIWIGSEGEGVSRWVDGKFQTFTGSHGLKGKIANPILAEPDGTIWITSDAGLNRWRNGRFTLLTTAHGLPDQFTYSLLPDGRGNYWSHCNRGIWRVRAEELNATADGRTNRFQVVLYGEADGMASAEGNGEQSPNACRSPDGRLWFPTTRGVVVVNPATLLDNEVPPPVVIQQVIADDTIVFGDPPENEASAIGVHREMPAEMGNLAAFAPDGTCLLPAGRARILEIHYTANSFVDPRKVRFRFRLFGRDENWRFDNVNRRTAIYTDLRPGRYRFEVTACNNHGIWNDTPRHFEFILAPHYYETGWFYALCGAAVVALAAAVQAYRLRVQRRLLHLEQQTALERERARIAQDMHDDLGASLTKIAILSDVAGRHDVASAPMKSAVEKISSTARGLIDSMSELVWATNPRNDTLDNLLSYLREYAARFFEGTPIDTHLEFPANAPAHTIKSELRRNLFLAVKEALNNIAKHSGATEVHFTAKLEGNTLRLLLRDNGHGFLANERLRPGNGLPNIRARIEQSGGSCRIESTHGAGATVEFLVPIADEKKEQQ